LDKDHAHDTSAGARKAGAGPTSTSNTEEEHGGRSHELAKIIHASEYDLIDSKGTSLRKSCVSAGTCIGSAVG
jgi:hypothetical protein